MKRRHRRTHRCASQARVRRKKRKGEVEGEGGGAALRCTTRTQREKRARESNGDAATGVERGGWGCDGCARFTNQQKRRRNNTRQSLKMVNSSVRRG